MLFLIFVYKGEKKKAPSQIKSVNEPFRRMNEPSMHALQKLAEADDETHGQPPSVKSY